MLFKQLFWWIFKFLLVLNLLLHFLQTECLFSKCCFKLLLSVNFLLQIWHLISLHILTCSPISIEVVKVWLHLEHVQFWVSFRVSLIAGKSFRKRWCFNRLCLKRESLLNVVKSQSSQANTLFSKYSYSCLSDGFQALFCCWKLFYNYYM